jgi:hypothetical protein
LNIVLRWGLLCGVAIAAVDLATALYTAGRSVESPEFLTASTLDWLFNVLVFSYCGYRVGTLTRSVRPAAEAAVIAGALVGMVALAASQLIPLPLGQDAPSLVGLLAQNVAIGGVLGLVNAFLAVRQSSSGK